MPFQLSIKKYVTCKRAETPNLLEYASSTRSEGTFNDFTVKAENQDISVHRLVLASCSKFFANMFKTNMKEKYQGFIKIRGYSGNIIRNLIEFMYTGSIVIDNENVFDVLSVADFLQLDEVKKFCFEFLGSCLAADNCLAILSATKLYYDEALSKKIHQIMGDSLEDITQSDDFKFLEKDDLMYCLSTINRNKISEASFFHVIVTWTKATNDETRKKCFPDLLRLIKLEDLSTDFLENFVLVEDLITGNPESSKMVMTSMIQSLKGQKKQNDKCKILSLGGSFSRKTVIEIYNLKESGQDPNVWCNMPYEVNCFCAVKLSNYIYCIGGRVNTVSQQRVWKIDISSSQRLWEEIAPIEIKRQLMGAAIYKGNIVVAGGYLKINQSNLESENELSSVEFLSPSLNKWKTIASLNQKRSGNALVTCNGFLYALGGGSSYICLSSVERYRDLNAAWEFVAPMQTPRRWFAAVTCNDEIYAIGGCTDIDLFKTIKSVEKYSTEADSWVYVKDMKYERSGASACVLQGRIFVSGGLDSQNQVIMPLECYDPSTDSWIVVETSVRERLLSHAIIAM